MPLIIFDFDKTLIPVDTGFEYIRFMLRRSRVRKVLARLVSPLGIGLLFVPPLRYWGISLFAWIATFPTTREALKATEEPYLDWLFDERGLGLYPAGVARIRAYQRQGHRVVIVTGSPRGLAEAVLRRAGLDGVDVIGSGDGVLLGGAVCTEHCIGGRKITCCRQAGLDLDELERMYSDSLLDLPLLRRAREAVLVNPKTRAHKAVRAVVPHVNVERWTLEPEVGESPSG